jgi:hypothetical protein
MTRVGIEKKAAGVTRLLLEKTEEIVKRQQEKDNYIGV